MKRIFSVIISLTVLLIIWGCPNGSGKQKYYQAWFPENATNLAEINSQYDDFNSVLPETHFGKQLIFSSNRRSAGENFDIIGDNLHAIWYWDEGKLIVDDSYYWQNTDYVGSLLREIDKNDNQFAPYFISFDTVIENEQRRVHLLAYSTNSLSNCFRSEFLFNITDEFGENGDVFGSYEIPCLGNCSQQQYVSFYGRLVENLDIWELNPNNFTQMYFDETGNDKSNIYKTNIPDSLNFMQFLFSDDDFGKTAVSALNSNHNDKCPFINGNFMVFTSDRPGGFGGYDLYYSIYEMGEWTEPINFGERINTEFDEFRPIVAQVMEFKNDLMVFSSNRDGGLGGFDLYYVGINKISPIQIPD